MLLDSHTFLWALNEGASNPETGNLLLTSLLDIPVAHCHAVSSLPYHHQDPFDRLLAAQAIGDNLDLIGADPIFDCYGVRRIW